MKLFIVESPAKCPLIRRYLPDGFHVLASVGHIRDLDKKELSIDVDNNYKPKWKIIPNKNNIVKMIKNAVEKASMVYLATDLDLEGESISWHLAQLCKIPNEKIRRVTFNQITKNAINNALEEADKEKSQIDMDRVNAQLARRIMDRLVGYKLSPCLWRHVGDSLSAGRVQSVALKLVFERENHIKNFNPVSSFKVDAYFVPNKSKSMKPIKFTLNKELASQNEASEYLNKIKSSEFEIVDITEDTSIKSPFPAFTTSTLQQTASFNLGISPKATMDLAQKLYEKGMITYMRTDSTSLSSNCINMAKDLIISQFGEKYFHPRSANLQKNSQGAHEAIRPTKISNDKKDFEDKRMEALYDLITKRTVASQMAPSQYLNKTIKVSPIDNKDEIFICRVSTLIFDGFLKLSGKDVDVRNNDEIVNDKKDIKNFTLKNRVYPLQFLATEHFSQPKPHFTEASLVNAMSPPPSGIGIGRPSTYANILSNIKYKRYVAFDNFTYPGKRFTILKIGNLKDIVKKTNKLITNESVSDDKEEKYRLFPTELGIKIIDFMEENFANIIDYSFTSKMETQLDMISEGNREWKKTVDECYKSFIPQVNKLMTNKVDEENKVAVVRNRLLGKLKGTDKEIWALIGKYGPVLRVGKGKTVKFYNLKKCKKELNDITLADSLEIIKNYDK